MMAIYSNYRMHRFWCNFYFQVLTVAEASSVENPVDFYLRFIFVLAQTCRALRLPVWSQVLRSDIAKLWPEGSPRDARIVGRHVRNAGGAASGEWFRCTQPLSGGPTARLLSRKAFVYCDSIIYWLTFTLHAPQHHLNCRELLEDGLRKLKQKQKRQTEVHVIFRFKMFSLSGAPWKNLSVILK